jgi:hypothetical protein
LRANQGSSQSEDCAKNKRRNTEKFNKCRENWRRRVVLTRF